MISSFFRNNLLFLFFLVSGYGLAQKQDRIWLFADSAGIDFNNLSSPLSISSNIGNPCLTSTATISNNQGNLLFYSAGVDLTLFPMRAFDRNGNVMPHGDSLRGYPWVCQGNMILPVPGDTNRYYLFVGDRTGSMGNFMYYNIIDMRLNNGLGDVVSKNNLLLSDWVNEKLNATRHANGRDWWVIVQSTNTDSLFHKFLITPDSIIGPIDQKIGSGDNRDKAHGQMIFSRDGTRLGLVSSNATVDFFDFDRCTGELYNYRGAGEGVTTLENYYFGCSFSPNGNVFYTSSIWFQFKNVYQYDLTTSDIRSSKQTVFAYADTGLYQDLELGEHLLGPDDKIYVVKGNGFHDHNSDTYETHHLDVILDPDQVGTACNYQSSYFDLGTGRGIEGLPTMINYNLGPVIGSTCDSLSIGVKEISEIKSFELFPNPLINELQLHALVPVIGELKIYNELGKIIFTRRFSGSEHFDVSSLTAGVYHVEVDKEGGVFKEKFLKME